MTAIVTGTDIALAIRETQPTRIAVAYLGADWRDYLVNPENIDHIVISPTFGSNPRAILDLCEVLTWEKILFLDELHAKIYLGSKSAVVGSANLTANGLCGEALLECSAVLNSDADLHTIAELIDAIVSRAKQQYPTTEAKVKKVASLKIMWNKAFSANLIDQKRNRTNTINTIEKYRPAALDDFYVLWYMNANTKYSPELELIKSRICDEIHFHPNDKPLENRYVLKWCKNLDDSANKKTKLYWMYIHEIFKDGIRENNYSYTTAAVQLKNIAVPPVPFEITENITAKFIELIDSKRLNHNLVQSEENFQLKLTFEAIPALLAALQ